MAGGRKKVEVILHAMGCGASVSLALAGNAMARASVGKLRPRTQFFCTTQTPPLARNLVQRSSASLRLSVPIRTE